MIYVHIPFCRSFCTYCDFYSEIASGCCGTNEEEKFVRYAEALANEVRYRAGEFTGDVNTLYIGGGTPSVLPLYVLETLLSALRQVGYGGPYEEFSLEVNPDDIVAKGEAYAEGLLESGVNRISMGVQSFDDDILRWMNRRHDSASAVKAYRILENAGFSNISIDLIFGLPQLSDAKWEETLKRAIDISSSGKMPAHISSYQLSVEPGSVLAELMSKGRWNEASEELCGRQYDILCSVLQTAGYNHYEISNFALPGYEALHNSAYWRHVPYVGLGPGAHSLRCDRQFIRQWNVQDLKTYLEASESHDFGKVQEIEVLDDDQVFIERIMLGLRTSGGVPEVYMRSHCDERILNDALSSGILDRQPDGSLRIPESQFFISDSIISSLI